MRREVFIIQSMAEKRTCYYCKANEPKKSFVGKCWVEERQYLGPYGRILKEQMVGGGKSNEEREPIKIIYYCSMSCMEEQNDKEEKEL